MTDYSPENLYHYMLINHADVLESLLPNAIWSKYYETPIVDIHDPRFFDSYFIHNRVFVSRELITIIKNSESDPTKIINMITDKLLPKLIIEDIANHNIRHGINAPSLLELQLLDFLPKIIILDKIVNISQNTFRDIIDTAIKNNFTFKIKDINKLVKIHDENMLVNLKYFANKIAENYIEKSTSIDVYTISFIHCDEFYVNKYSGIDIILDRIYLFNELLWKKMNWNEDGDIEKYQCFYDILFDRLIYFIKYHTDKINSNRIKRIILIFLSNLTFSNRHKIILLDTMNEIYSQINIYYSAVLETLLNNVDRIHRILNGDIELIEYIACNSNDCNIKIDSIRSIISTELYDIIDIIINNKHLKLTFDLEANIGDHQKLIHYLNNLDDTYENIYVSNTYQHKHRYYGPVEKITEFKNIMIKLFEKGLIEKKIMDDILKN